MIHSYVTCDICNPKGKPPAENNGRGYYEGSLQAAVDAGWDTQAGGKHICPDCQGDEEEDAKRPPVSNILKFRRVVQRAED